MLAFAPQGRSQAPKSSQDYEVFPKKVLGSLDVTPRPVVVTRRPGRGVDGPWLREIGSTVRGRHEERHAWVIPHVPTDVKRPYRTHGLICVYSVLQPLLELKVQFPCFTSGDWVGGETLRTRSGGKNLYLSAKRKAR